MALALALLGAAATVAPRADAGLTEQAAAYVPLGSNPATVTGFPDGRPVAPDLPDTATAVPAVLRAA